MTPCDLWASFRGRRLRRHLERCPGDLDQVVGPIEDEDPDERASRTALHDDVLLARRPALVPHAVHPDPLHDPHVRDLRHELAPAPGLDDETELGMGRLRYL